MAINDTILATKYNDIRNKVNGVLGTGIGASGYGQGLGTTAVRGPSAGTSPADVITDTQWDQLRADITKCRRHQTGQTPTITDVADSDLIYWATAEQYDLLADSIVTNRDVVYAGATGGAFTTQVQTINGGSTTLSSGWGTNAANQRYGEQRFNVTFASADAARYFFNTGGQLVITLSRSGTATNTKSTGWQGIVDFLAAQNITFDATRYRQGLAGTATQWGVQRFDTTNPYTENFGLAGFQWISSTAIRVIVQMVDEDIGDQTGIGPAVDETVSIDITAGLNYRKSINEVTVESYLPSFTVASWTLNA
jgi:hypothetical protein